MEKHSGEIIEVNFKPAKGGVISEARYRKKRSGQGGGPDWDYVTENAVHATLEDATACLKEKLGHTFKGNPGKHNSSDKY